MQGDHCLLASASLGSKLRPLPPPVGNAKGQVKALSGLPSGQPDCDCTDDLSVGGIGGTFGAGDRTAAA